MRTSGYQDALQGRTVPYWGTLRQLLVALLAALAAVLAEMTSLSAAEIDVSWRARVVAFLVWATPSALAVAIGVRLGQTVGLGAPVVRGWVVGEANLGRRIQSLLPATLVGGIGVINSMALHLAGPWFEKHLWPDMPENARRAVEAASHTPGWKMILASFAGGVCEELVFRFGLMTLIVCLGTKLAGLARPGTAMLWIAILLAVVPFALVHLVNAAGLEIPVTFGLVITILVLNGAAGLVFGWP